MSKFYPAEKTRQLRVQIEKFMQLSDESFYEARERFLNLLSQCPHHRLSEMDLCCKFYEGLDWEAQNMVDMTVVGSIVTASPAALNQGNSRKTKKSKGENSGNTRRAQQC